MKRIIAIGILALFLGTFSPSVASAHVVGHEQIRAVVLLLQALNVDKSTIKIVEDALTNEKETAASVAETVVPVIGKTVDGLDVFQDTGLYAVDAKTGCHHRAYGKDKNGLYKVAPRAHWCPPTE